jgi:hypothetical protein
MGEYARLSAANVSLQPILCSLCNYEFGFVHDPTCESLGRGPAFDPDQLLEPRKIYLWPVWQAHPVNGVLNVSKRARRRLRNEKIPTRRRSYVDGPEYIAYSPKDDLPITLRCPQCNWLQILDREKLKADRVRQDDDHVSDAPPILKVSRDSIGRLALKRD